MAASATPLRTLDSAEQIDQTLLAERHRAVLIRFGRRTDPTSAAMDVILHEIAYEIWLFCVIYLVDMDVVTEFTALHELYDPCTLMCFYRNRPLPINVGYGPDTKVTWPLCDSSVLTEAIIRACLAKRDSSAGGGVAHGFVKAFQGLLFGMSLG
jgi:DIM1 family U5 snRNP protein